MSRATQARGCFGYNPTGLRAYVFGLIDLLPRFTEFWELPAVLDAARGGALGCLECILVLVVMTSYTMRLYTMTDNAVSRF